MKSSELRNALEEYLDLLKRNLGFGRIPKAFIIQIQTDMPVIKGEKGLVNLFFQ